VFSQAMAEERDPDAPMKASALIQELTGRIEKQLSETEFLVGDSLTAADITAAPLVRYSMLPEEAANQGPVHQFFYESFKLGDGRDRTRDWVNKVIAYDR